MLCGSGELVTVWLEDELQKAAPEVRAVHPLARRSEQNLLDKVAEVFLLGSGGRAAAAVKVKRIIGLH
jgi:hypothetical protein